MTIEFNLVAMEVAFAKHLTAHLLILQRELEAHIQAGLGTPEGKADVQSEAIKIAGHWITASVRGGPWAIIDSFGSGSLMSVSNPALGDYMNSPFWNRWRSRSNRAIMSRDPGEVYPDFFTGELKRSKSRRGGYPLEHLSKYKPTPPSHAFLTAIRWMQQARFWEVVNRAMATFPFHQFIIVKNTRG